MSKKSFKQYGEPSTHYRQLFDETCHKLGMEIRNEERAQENQVKLREALQDLEAAFNAAVGREQESARIKAADEAKKAAKAKPVETPAVTPEATPTPDKQADAQP